eukprot:GAHX01001805.1.p1 GENE.GAHX01001805.1~~GAHX01001805.1.p1  ORF type:complete len:391 (-),score=69.21 GAHX01001805.1:141-1313(-)
MKAPRSPKRNSKLFWIIGGGILILVNLAVIVVIIVAWQSRESKNDPNIENKSSETTESEESYTLYPGKDYTIKFKEGQSFEVDTFRENEEFYAIRPDREDIKALYDSLGDFKPRLLKLEKDFKATFNTRNDYKNNLGLEIEEKIITLDFAIPYEIFNEIQLYEDFENTIKELQKEITDYPQNEKNMETIRTLFKTKQFMKFRLYYLPERPALYCLNLYSKVRKYYVELSVGNLKWKKLRYLFQDIKLGLLTPGDKKFEYEHKDSIIGKTIIYDALIIKDLDMIEYMTVHNLMDFLEKLFVLDDNGKIIERRVLKEEQLRNIAIGGSKDNIEEIEKQKTKIKRTSEVILNILFDGRMEFNVRELKGWMEALRSSIMKIKNQCKSYEPRKDL